MMKKLKTAVISPEVHAEWIIFHNLLAKNSKDSIALQLKDLITNEMLVTMFPNLQWIVSIGLTLPVATASVERSFSQMKLKPKHAYETLSLKAGSLIY